MAKAIRNMNDEPKTAPRIVRWKWLRTLTLALWAGLALGVATMLGTLPAETHALESYPEFHYLFGVSAWLMLGLLPTASISVLLHAVALFKQRIAAKSAYLGMVSGVLVIIGDLLLMGYVAWWVNGLSLARDFPL